MEDVKTRPHKSGDKTTPYDVPVGQALFSDPVWLPWTGEKQNAAEKKRKQEDAQNIGIYERTGKRTDREDREPVGGPYFVGGRGNFFARRLLVVGHREDYSVPRPETAFKLIGSVLI